MRTSVCLTLAVFLTSTGCDLAINGPMTIGSGVTKNETREVGDFTGIEVSSTFEATVTIGPKTSVALDVDDNLIALVKTEVRDGRLHVGFEKGQNIQTNQPQKVTIVMPKLDSLTASGASKILATPGEGKSLKIEVDGSSSAEIKDMASDSVEVNVSGASKATLAGQSKRLKLNLSGASKLIAVAATFESATVDLSGASSGELTVTNSIDGELSGACSLKVRGEPKTRAVSTSGASSVSY